jgi:hypothetical protein
MNSYRLAAPAVTSKVGDGIRWAGQTFDGTPDGRPVGQRQWETLQADSKSCFTVSMPPLSAAMLEIIG